ncbi:hypothetical protein [Galbibacter sp.]|uniref:hypothetical protein n=1 Tax=Galbibacter sp. TaxID=2918471 RepID=UPI003A8E6C3A
MFKIDLARNLQSEFSIFNGHKKHDDFIVHETQNFLKENYLEKISIETLPRKLNVGRRNLDPRFKKATDLTPLKYLQRVKTEAAKKAFENTRLKINEVMYDVG